MIKYIKTWFNYTTNCFAGGLIRCMKIQLNVNQTLFVLFLRKKIFYHEKKNYTLFRDLYVATQSEMVNV